MDLSIVTPAAPKRYDRVKSIFERLSLNYTRHQDIMFEFIIVDDSLDREYEILATNAWPFPVKYISLPLTDPYPNPSYMRNVGFRVAEGKVFAMIDSDHWISEDFVHGAINTPHPCLNTGFMIDTSRGAGCPIDICSATNVDLNNPYIANVMANTKILIANSSRLSFKEAMKVTGINGPVRCNRVWLASYPSEVFLDINGYDEHYTAGYGREDDDIYYRIASRVPPYHDNFQSFCGVHMWHPQSARSPVKSLLNRAYYDRTNSSNAIRNNEHLWGKFVEGSYSIIDGVKRGFTEHKKWIEYNALAGIGYVDDRPWRDYEELRKDRIE